MLSRKSRRDATLATTMKKFGLGETSVSSHQPAFERVVTPDGVSVSVGEWGNPAGPEILLIHGQAQRSCRSGGQTDGELARDFRIVAYDLRGHGLSDKPADPAFYQDGKRWAEEMNAVIAAKRLRAPVAVGWSMGGRVLRQYLIHYGDGRLSGLNFLATRPIEDPSVVGPASKAYHADTRSDLAGRIAANVAFLRACYEKQPDERDFETAVAYNFMVPFEVRDAIAGWATDPNAVRKAFARSRCRRWSPRPPRCADPAAHAAGMTAAAIKDATVSLYDDCGHAPFYEDATRYNRELADFTSRAWSRRDG